MDGESLLLFNMRGAEGGRASQRWGSERWEEQEVWVREVGEREVGETRLCHYFLFRVRLISYNCNIKNNPLSSDLTSNASGDPWVRANLRDRNPTPPPPGSPQGQTLIVQ